MSTDKNLKEAFAGESQANRRYLAFAAKAADDGYAQVAKLFRAAADAETVHALAHLNVLGEVSDIETNLNAAIRGENYEHTSMYPPFIEEADTDGNTGAAISFIRANAVEKIHEDLFTQALDAVKGGTDLSSSEIFVCQVCGNTVLAEAPEVCPICGSPKAKFKLIS